MSDSAELAPLLEVLEEDAQREVDRLLEAARARADQIVAKAEERAQALLAGAAAEGRAEGEREARRRLALAELDERHEALRLRDAALERVLAGAIQLLRERADGPQGDRLLGELVGSAARVLGDARLRVKVRAQDRECLAAGLPGVDAELVLDDETIAEPGAIVSSLDGRRSVDVTLPALVHRRREASRRAAAQVLFGDGSSP